MLRSAFYRTTAASAWLRASGDQGEVVISGLSPETDYQVDIGDGITRDFTTLAAAGGPQPLGCFR